MSFRKGRKLPGAEFTWDTDPNGEPDTAPTPLFPKYNIPKARPLSEKEQRQVDTYRDLRERFHDGPYYSILDSSSSAAKKGDPARANFDPFHGMPSYSGRYQKKKRTVPKLVGRPYVMKFFPRELWKTIQPSFRPDAGAADGFVAQVPRGTAKRGFEDDDEEEEDNDAGKRRRTGEDDVEGEGNDDILEGEEEEQDEEEIVDSDFEDDEDEMGGDYNAEQYFDGGDDEFGDDGFGDGGGGGDEETF